MVDCCGVCFLRSALPKAALHGPTQPVSMGYGRTNHYTSQIATPAPVASKQLHLIPALATTSRISWKGSEGKLRSTLQTKEYHTFHES
ncbi:hypothetical protein NDU88_010876 [Pleurodeles waltl]|uniref:Uncharacterized protein n=1 Tax=Pleurodeles waltl TaxID=8319 RepID=A0AAV7S2G6_PLEWA|nr:hypothetical protein NDU88_010876 [Pleurodeles waltl]